MGCGENSKERCQEIVESACEILSRAEVTRGCQLSDSEFKNRALYLLALLVESSASKCLEAKITHTNVVEDEVTQVSMGAVTLDGYYISNTNQDSTIYVKFYDLNVAPDITSDSIKLEFPIPAGGAANLSDLNILFADGLGYAVSLQPGAVSDIPNAGDVVVNLWYK
jgi:hypothetical protein